VDVEVQQPPHLGVVSGVMFGSGDLPRLWGMAQFESQFLRQSSEFGPVVMVDQEVEISSPGAPPVRAPMTLPLRVREGLLRQPLGEPLQQPYS
jgi:hypothetical protein